MKRKCKICSDEKEITDFYRDRDDYKYACKKCYHFYMGRGLSKNDYDKIYKEQEGKCSICSKNKKLVVDHNHKTNKVRGLVCSPCNVAIAIIENGADVNKISKYLNEDKYNIPY